MTKQMFAVLAVLAVLWVAAPTVPSFSQSKETTLAKELAGKTVLVYAPSVAGGRYHVVTDVEVIRVGGRMYVAGIGGDTGQSEEKNWEKGLPVRIAADYIAAYYPLTQEQYQTLQKRGLPQQWPEKR